jgi:hypothetical protein
VTKQDGSNCPFTIKSFTSFKRLRDLVSEKLGCYPGSLKLRYRLDTDKPKTPATSIHSVDELKIFRDRMRLLIVPQRLASGKISSRHLRPVTVCFEDGSNTDQSSSQSTSRPGATSADKQVCNSIYVSFLKALLKYRRPRGRHQSPSQAASLRPTPQLIPRCHRRQQLRTCSSAGSVFSTRRPKRLFAGSRHNPIASVMSLPLPSLGSGQWR